MPLFFEQHDLIKASVYLWKIEEPDIFFIEQMPWHQKQLDWLDSIHPQKRMEYLASRFLIYQLTGKLDSHLYKDEAGKLHLEDSNQHVSISHSGEYVGLALSERIVGFDLQKSSAKIHKIAKRFLSKEEYKWLSTQPAEKNLIQAWTIKEAVYKAHGKKGIRFSEQIVLELSAFEQNILNVHATQLKLSDYEKKYAIHHDWMDDFAWAIATEV